MTLELFSTSVPAGLETGRSGFCTVAMTRNLSRPLVEALESLSAYRPVFLPPDPRARENPVTVSYLRVPVAGRNYHVVSRICAAGLDYTNRSNRFAHHVVLDTNDPRPLGGPAWLATRPGFLEPTFDGKIHYLPAGRPVPAGEATSAACPTWQKLTGDPGWAGVVAEALANPTARSFFLVYDLGTNVLTLLQEAIGLLPPDRRWEATFTTYFTGLPAGVSCAVRGVLRGSAEAASAQGASSLDLGKLAGKTPPVNEWTQAARAGKAVATRQIHVNAPMPMKQGTPLSPAQLAGPQPLSALSPARNDASDAFAMDEPRLVRDEKPGGVGKWVVLTILGSLLVLGGGAGAAVMLGLFRKPHPVVEHDKEKDKDPTIEEKEKDKDKAGKSNDKEKLKPSGKFKPSKALLTMDRPVVGVPSVVRVNLNWPKGATRFPLDKLRFEFDDKDLPAKQQGDGFLVTLPKAGPHKLLAKFAEDDRYDKLVMALDVKVLEPLPKFTINAKAGTVTRGDRVEVSLQGLPKKFTGFGKIVLVGQGDGPKVTPSSDGNKPIVLEGLKPDKYSLQARFPGNDTYASGESNAIEIRVQRKPVFEYKPIDRNAFSRGKFDLNVTIKGSNKDDPLPKGELQLKSETEVIAGGKIDAKGGVVLSKAGVEPGTYGLKLVFTPEAKDEWTAVEQPLQGTWQVVPTSNVKLDLAERDLGPRRQFAVRFKVPEPIEKVEGLPPGKKYFLEFRPTERSLTGELKITGKFVPKFDLVPGTTTVRLGVQWETAKDSWDKNPLPKSHLFPIVAIYVVEPSAKKVEAADDKDEPASKDEKEGKPKKKDKLEYNKDGAVRLVLNNAFPPAEPFVPLVTSFRNVVKSLHGAEIEIYEGTDTTEKVKDAKGKDTGKTVTVRVKKDASALPLLRLKLYDK